MNGFSPFLSHWHGQVKQFFTRVHGQQTKVLAMFVLGAMRAESLVVQRVAGELLEASDAKVPSIERRLERFLSNKRIEVETIWDQFLGQVLPIQVPGEKTPECHDRSDQKQGDGEIIGPGEHHCWHRLWFWHLPRDQRCCPWRRMG